MMPGLKVTFAWRGIEQMYPKHFLVSGTEMANVKQHNKLTLWALIFPSHSSIFIIYLLSLFWDIKIVNNKRNVY